MKIDFTKWIGIFFSVLLFLVPLILFPKTSELFEFNKIILVYFVTTIIISLWIARSIVERRFTFKRTLIDYPLLIFLVTQLLSTLISFDTRTSVFGYYSRFHGGLLSSVSYALLYWAYVSNLNKKKTIKTIYSLLASSILVSAYGVLQHFGIDKDIWVQDVQNRIFSTLGQPNWLAAWVVSLIPLTWAFALKSRFNEKKYWFWVVVSSLLFLTLIYTKSRSGFLGLGGAVVVFILGLAFLQKSKKLDIKKIKREILAVIGSLLLITLISGTVFTPGLGSLISKSNNIATNNTYLEQKVIGPALEVGGTASTEIRKIVWKGAIDIWKNYPILGTGVETFAYSYYNFRPPEHNLVSEWDFLYNKAHNEYLNFIANTGLVGTLAYLILIVFILIQLTGLDVSSRLKLFKNLSSSKSSFSIYNLGLLSGFVSILLTNFFGFSVVPVALSFFLFPAFAVSLDQKSQKTERYKSNKINNSQISLLLLLITFALLLLYSVSKYWKADYLYAQGKIQNDAGNYKLARQYLQSAIKLSSKEPVFWEELGESTTSIAVQFYEESNEINQDLIGLALTESRHAVELAPNNVNLKRKLASNLISLSVFDPQFLLEARQVLLTAAEQAPTDAKIIYNLGLAYLRTGDLDSAADTLASAVELKSDYRNAHFALALVELDRGNVESAFGELDYILKNINPNDQIVINEIEELKQSYPNLTN